MTKLAIKYLKQQEESSLFRRMGKNGFGKIQDPTGQIQYYVKKDEVGEDEYEIYKKLGMGDFIGIEGTLFRTKTGELTLRAKSFEVLSKKCKTTTRKIPWINKY